MGEAIEIGYQAFVSDGGEEFGAVRAVSPNGRPRTCDLRGECRGIRCATLCSRGSTFAEGYLELRQAGAAPSTGDRSRTRCRRAQRLNRPASHLVLQADFCSRAKKLGITVDLGDVPTSIDKSLSITADSRSSEHRRGSESWEF